MKKKPTQKQMETAVRTLLRGLGEDPKREGLADTPKRYVRALEELTLGYHGRPDRILKTLFDAEGYDQQIVLTDIPFHSMCEHHMLPFSGTADVGYIPGRDGRIFGISKLARLVDAFARRLQNQERITKQIADALAGREPRGVAVVLQAKHACVMCRGVMKPAKMVTSVMEGAFRQSDAARAEFFELRREGGRAR